MLKVASELALHSVVYKELEEEDDETTRTGRSVVRWKTMNAGVLTPVMLWLKTHELPSAELERALVGLESFLVRRMVCGLGTRGYFDVSKDLLSRLKYASPETAGSVIVQFLSEQETDRLRWPDDESFRRHLQEERLYDRSGVSRSRLQMVLKAIARQMHSDKSEMQIAWNKLSIEHIMSQSWEECYPLDFTDVTENGGQDPRVRRERLVHSLGNLTLVTPSFNSALSNKCWDEKRDGLLEHTVSTMNFDITQHVHGQWSEEEILRRGKRLAEVALEVWPGPKALLVPGKLK